MNGNYVFINFRRKMPEKMDLAAIALKAKAMDVLKSSSDKRNIRMNLKTQLVKKSGVPELSDLRKTDKLDAAQGKKRTAASPPSGDSAPKVAAVGKTTPVNKKSTSRREELLKQLKAVEDAIAKKRSKIN